MTDTDVPEGEDVRSSDDAPPQGPGWGGPQARLRGRPRTDEARALTAAVFKAVVDGEGARKYARGPAQAEKVERAVGAFLADLLSARRDPKAPGWTSRPLGKRWFSRQAVSHAHFEPVWRGMEALGLLETVLGYGTSFISFVDSRKREQGHGRVTRFRATERLAALAEAHGVQVAEPDAHFSTGTPEEPVVLKTRKVRHHTENYDAGGDPMKLPQSAVVDRLRAEVAYLNTFLDERVIRGGVHRGYRRIFHNGDVPGFSWDQGGRLYSVGGGYQQMEEEERRRMTIDGARLCEIDVHASYLTILHGLCRESLAIDPDRDLYVLDRLSAKALPGCTDEVNRKALRTVVKMYVAQTWGVKKHPTRWSKSARDAFTEDTGLMPAEYPIEAVYPVRAIRDAVLDTYPLLGKWGTLPVSWPHLMFAESTAVLNTMLELARERGVPTLAVHDALLVPVDHCELAVKTLQASYRVQCGLVPRITVDGPL